MTASTPTTAIAVYEPPASERGDLLYDPAAYRHAMEVSATLALSQMIPKQFQGKAADVFIGLQLARRMNLDAMTVLQAMQVINGTPSWRATFIIARLNSSGKFTDDVDWEVSGKGDTLTVTAYATKHNGKRVEETVDMGMAKAEGWTRNPKYNSIPKLMLKYRAVTFLCRLHAPEVLLGLPVADEVEDISFTEVDNRPVRLVEDLHTGESSAPAQQPSGMAAVNAALGEEPKPTSTATPVSGTQAAEDKGEQQQNPTSTANDIAERARLLAELAELAKVLPQEDRDRLKKEHGLQRIMPNADLGKVAALVAACRAEIEKREQGKPTVHDPAVLSAVMDWESKLSDDAVFAAAEAAGMPFNQEGGPDADTATPEQLAQYLDELKARG